MSIWQSIHDVDLNRYGGAGPFALSLIANSL